MISKIGTLSKSGWFSRLYWFKASSTLHHEGIGWGTPYHGCGPPSASMPNHFSRGSNLHEVDLTRVVSSGALMLVFFLTFFEFLLARIATVEHSAAKETIYGCCSNWEISKTIHWPSETNYGWGCFGGSQFSEPIWNTTLAPEGHSNINEAGMILFRTCAPAERFQRAFKKP